MPTAESSNEAGWRQTRVAALGDDIFMPIIGGKEFPDFLIRGKCPHWLVAYMETGLLMDVYYDAETRLYRWEKAHAVPGYEATEAEEQEIGARAIAAVKKEHAIQ